MRTHTQPAYSICMYVYADNAYIYFCFSHLAVLLSITVGTVGFHSSVSGSVFLSSVLSFFFIPRYIQTVINLILMILCKAKCSVYVCVCGPQGVTGGGSSQT